MENKRLTKKIIEKNVDGYVLNHREDFTENTYEVIQKLGQLEDLEEELGVNDLIHFLNWCVKFRTNFINRSFDDLVKFYKKAMCETEKDKSE